MTLMKERDEVAEELAKARLERRAAESSATDATKKRLASLEFDLSEKTIDIARLQTLLDDMGAKFRASAATVENLERQLATSSAELKSAQAMIERSKVDDASAAAWKASQVESYKSHIERLNAELASTSDKLASVTSDLYVARAQINANSEDIDELNAERARQAKSYQSDIERLNAALASTNEKLTASAIDLKAAQAQIERSKADEVSKAAQAKSYQSDIERLNAALASTNDKVASLSFELHTARAQVNARSGDIDDAYAENVRLRADIDRLNDTVTLTNSTMSQKDALIDKSRDEVAKAVEERDQAREALASALLDATSKDQLRDVDRQAREQAENTLEEVRAALRMKAGECATSETALASLRFEIEDLRARLDKESKRAMTNEEKALSAKEAFAARLSAAAEKQNSFQGRMLEMKSQIDEEKKLIEAKAREAVDELNVEIAEIKKQLAEKEKAYIAATKRATDRETELVKVLDDLNNTKSALLEVKSKAAEDAIAGVEFTTLSRELADAKAQVKALESAQRSSGDEIKASKKQLQLLEGTIAGLEGAADLAAAESEDLRRLLETTERDAKAAAEDHELASSMAAKAMHAVQAKANKLEKQIVILEREIEALNERNSKTLEDRESTEADFQELYKKCDASDKRVRDLTAEVKSLEQSVASEKSLSMASERRAQTESEARMEAELEIDSLRGQVTTAESRVNEINAAFALLEKQLDKERRKPDERRDSGAGDLKAMTASRDAAVRRAKDLQDDLAKVTHERQLLQDAMSNLEKRLEYERHEFAKQLREAVLSAVKEKDREMLEIRRELSVMREASTGGESSSANLSRAFEAKQQELAAAHAVVSGLRADITSLQHQLEHANATVLAERRRVAVNSDSDSEVVRLRAERDAVKHSLSEAEAKLSDALAAKQWLEGSVAATEAELEAAREAAAAATAMSEQARAQLSAISRQQSLSPKLLTSPKRRSARPFGSPMMDAQLASPLKWFSRRAPTQEVARTPPNNLFKKFTSTAPPTPLMPMRTPGGSWRVPSRPENAAEALAAAAQFLMIAFMGIVCIMLIVAVSPIDVDSPLYTDSSSMRMYVRTLKKSMTLEVPTADSASCGSVKQRFQDGFMEILHSLIGRHYRSPCANNFPS